jgi:hypothetical protein
MIPIFDESEAEGSAISRTFYGKSQPLCYLGAVGAGLAGEFGELPTA